MALSPKRFQQHFDNYSTPTRPEAFLKCWKIRHFLAEIWRILRPGAILRSLSQETGSWGVGFRKYVTQQLTLRNSRLVALLTSRVF